MSKQLLIWGFLLGLLSCQSQNNESTKAIKNESLGFDNGLEYVKLGEIQAQGWLKAQMERDLVRGFVGTLDTLCPDLILNDDIYGDDRLTKEVKDKDVGRLHHNSELDIHVLWWNSETQSNWRDGWIRHAILTRNEEALEKVAAYVKAKLATQDEDGYLGIYANDLRYQHPTENGELWAQSSLLRGLLAYYEYTQDTQLLMAIEKAVLKTMQAYPIQNSQPFKVDKDWGGLGHGLTFTDVLDRLYQITGKKEYRDYALFLFEDYNRHPIREEDIHIKNVLNPDYRFKGHGVHTYEHLRSLTMAAYYSDDQKYQDGLEAYLEKLSPLITPSGAPIGDEWINGRRAIPDSIGYEYCSLQELLDAYGLLLQKSGDAHWANRMEWLLFNAAQGARHPQESAIAYCKTDNSYQMMGHLFPDQPQNEPRYKYSPVHQDIAVCCIPNAGRIYPYYIRSMWMKSERGLVANLFGPAELETQVNGKGIKIKQETLYPFDFNVTFRLELASENEFELAIRKPDWVQGLMIKTDAQIREDAHYYYLQKVWKNEDVIELSLKAEVDIREERSGQKYVTYGPLLFALAMESEAQETKRFAKANFRD
ncbi:MAG: beta-L-arabinofuranosidase domain-containing protein, partial [Bacteroidota bacterium]